MEVFNTHCGIAAPFIVSNVTTDALSPSKANLSSNTDLGAMLFADWRYHLDGSEDPEFVLNRLPYRSASILVGGANFGCGSSRERAVWALAKFGFRCVIAPSFADIFRNNCFQNGLLPVELDAASFKLVQDYVETAGIPELTVDLAQGHVEFPGGPRVPFSIPEIRRIALLNGLDELDALLTYRPAIDAFRNVNIQEKPWIYAVT